MQIKKFTLNKNPKFIIILNRTNFEVISEIDVSDNGIYEFANCTNFNLKRKKISWLATFIDTIVHLFTDNIPSGIQNENDSIHFLYNGNPKQFIVNDFDMLKVEEVCNRIRFKTNGSR